MSDELFATVQGADEELRGDPGYRYDNARRGDVDRLVVQRTLSGRAYFEESGVRREVRPGFAMLFTHREATEYGFPEGAAQPYRHRYLAVTPASGVREVFARLRADFGSIVRMAEDGEAVALFEELFEGFRRRGFRDRLHESELFYRLLMALYREQVQVAETRDPIEFGFHFLHDHFRAPVTLKLLAAKCGVSREHFIRRFRDRHGEPPGAMLRRLRLEAARSMLGVTELPVEKVARACGFVSSNSFCRAYRQRYGVAPGASRR
jgi:AraC-like DNA-binding protein